MLWLWEEVRFEAQNAHNAGLEAFLGLGIPGFALLVWALIRAGGIGLANLYGKPDRRRYALPAMLFVLMMGLTESVLVGPDGFIWLAFVTIATKAAMGAEVTEKRARRRSGRLYARPH